MTAVRRRRRSRVYLRAHIGCLGCSIPLLVFLALLAALVAVIA